jgi:hypothetical protein
MVCLKNIIRFSPSLIAAISLAACAVGEEQPSSGDPLIQELQVGGKTIVAASEKTALGWRTTVTDDNAATVYADVHIADSDGTWTGTIAGIDIGEPAAIDVAEWRRVYESEAGQVVMAASLQARALSAETDLAETDPLLTVGDIAGILEQQAGVAPESAQPVPYVTAKMSFLASLDLNCSPYWARYGRVTAQYGADVVMVNGPGWPNNLGTPDEWNTPAYHTVSYKLYRSSQWPKSGAVILYRDSRGKVASWTIGCVR